MFFLSEITHAVPFSTETDAQQRTFIEAFETLKEHVNKAQNLLNEGDIESISFRTESMHHEVVTMRYKNAETNRNKAIRLNRELLQLSKVIWRLHVASYKNAPSEVVGLEMRAIIRSIEYLDNYVQNKYKE